MSALVLTLRSRPAQRVDLLPLTAQPLAGRSIRDIAALPLPSGNRTIPLGELFAVEGTPGNEIEIRNSCDQLDRIGAGLAEGAITVTGDAGAFLGIRLAGGTITVQGSTGAWTAAGMTAGLIRVNGNTGDFLGGAMPGDHQGMKGGTVVVRGDAGARAGVSMKAGTILIEGGCGYMTGFMAQNGTIIVCGDAGEALADSMYEAVVYVGGSIRSLGSDAEAREPNAEELAYLNETLLPFGIDAKRDWKRVASGRRLWNFSRHEALWREAL